MSAALTFFVQLACSGGRGAEGSGFDDLPTEVEQIRNLIVPYGLEGSTADGLTALQHFLEDPPSERDESSGHLLRAQTLIDLWTFAQIAQGIDDAAARTALDIIAGQLGEIGSAPPLSDAIAYQQWRAQAAAYLQASVADSLEMAGRNRTEVERATDWIRFDIGSDSAAREFWRWRDTATNGPRHRLVLMRLLFRHADQWLSQSQSDEQFFFEFSWLCTEDPVTSFEQLATACGYYCATLAEPTVVQTIERDIFELAEDDTPVQWADEEDSEIVHGQQPDDLPELLNTPQDVGFQLVQACGWDYFNLPRGCEIVLLDELNFLNLVYLAFIGEQLSAIELSLLQGEPLTILSSELLGVMVDRFLSGGVPQHLTDAAVLYDPRMELPALPTSGPQVLNPGIELRLVSVRSNGVFLAVSPQIQLRRFESGYELAYVGSEFGIDYPGFAAVPFSNLGQLGDGAVVDGTIPALAQAISEFELQLDQSDWYSSPDPSIERSDCGVADGTPVSVLIDGATHMAAVSPVLLTLLECGYEPIRVQVYDTNISQLVDVPVTLSRDGVGDNHRLTLLGSTLSFRRSELEEDEEAFRIGPGVEAPLSMIYEHLRTSTSDGTIDSETPISVVPDPDTVNFGMLVNVINAIAYQREGELFEQDWDLLQASPLVEQDQSIPLIVGGVELELMVGAE